MVKDYYPQIFLEECRYKVTEKKTITYFTDKIEIFSYEEEDSTEEESKEDVSKFLFKVTLSMKECLFR